MSGGADPPARPAAAADDRLLELLTALGSAEPARLQEALEELRAARGRGERVDAAAFLAARGVVPPGLLEGLLGGGEEQPRAGGSDADEVEGSSGGPASGPAGAASADPPRPRSRKARRASLEAPPTDLVAEGAEQRAAADEPGAPRRSRKARRVSSDDLPRAARRPSGAAAALGEADRALDPDGPPSDAPGGGGRSGRRARSSDDDLPRAARSARQPAAARSPADDELTAGLELETRRFDPAALAAASAAARSSTGRPLPAWLLPATLGLALVLVLASVVGVVSGLLEGPPEQPLVADLPAPVLDPDEAGARPDDDLALETGASSGGAEPADAQPDAAAELPDPWPDLAERARALSDVERYGEARALLEGAPAEVQAAHAEAVGPTLGRLRALEAFAAAADEALRAAEELRRAGDHDAAARRVQAVLDGNPALAGSPTARRLEGARVEALEARAEAAPAAPPTRPEPPERAARFEAQAARGRELVLAIQARVRRDKERLGELRRAEAARARAASQAAPLDLELAPGYVVKGAVIDALDERGFTARPGGSGDTITRTWASVPDDLALRVRRLAARDDVADDQVRLGRWCLANYHFDAARQAFARAVALDPRLMGQVPDVADVVRSGRLFAGKSEHSGSSLELTYGFSRPAEAADFNDEPGTRGVLREGRLEVRGRGSFLSALTEVGFEERLEVKATLGPASRDALSVVGLSFGFGTRREVAWLVAVARGTGDLLLLRRQGGRVRTVERKQGVLKDEAAEVSLEVAGGMLRVRALRRTQLKAPLQPQWEGARVVVGGVAPQDGAGSIEALTVRGAVRPEWLRKAMGELDAKLRALLARSEELPVFVAPPGRPAAVPLSAEDEFGLEGVASEALEAYREGRVKAATGAPLDLLAAAGAFERALERSPGFAAAAYRRALALAALGRPHLALSGFEQASARCPRFYEAMAGRARVLATLGHLKEARAAADEAVAARPDHAAAWAARGQASFLAGDLEPALADLDVALGLDPWDDEVRARRKNVVHVLAGPPWERVFRRETQHYVVATDISQRRCDEYARDLEAVRSYYAERFGLAQGGPPDGPRATVLIFDTREGFHAYAELTTDDRVESLLGCYLPRYRQLLLYEDKDDATLEETRRVLFHEAFHQFMDGLVSDLPFWLNEGLAEYFSSCRVEADGRVTPPDASSRLESRIEELRRYVARDAVPVPFARLMNESPAEFYSGPVAAKYAQAWAMIHFFQHGGSRELGERFRRYVSALREGMAARRAFNAAWEGADWAGIHAAWLEYVKRL